jgi:MarR-like DNA-binding transcriptional regulator SgrR of sgrS sRNA
MKESYETLQDMLKAVAMEKWQEGDYTANMAADEMNCSLPHARIILEQWLEEGKVRKFRGAGPTGRVATIYRKID